MLNEMNLFAISSILIVITNFFIVFLVLYKGRTERSNIIWVVFCIYITCWGIGGYNFSTADSQQDALLWWQIANIGGICIPITYYQFVFSFLNLKKRYQKSILIASYTLGIIFLTFNFFLPQYFIGELRLAFDHIYMTGFSYQNPLYLIFYITFYGILLFYTFSLLVMSFLRSSGVVRNQLKYFIIASLIGWLGGHGYFLSAIKTDIYPYTNFLIAIYPIIFTYAILRYRLLDVRLLFKKTMAYSLSAGLLMAFFVIIVLFITNFLSGFTEVDSLTISIFAALIVAFLFNPLRNQVQILVDKLFYKKTYDYYATIRKVSHDLASMFDIKKIYGFVSYTILSTLGLKNIYFLSAEQGDNYKVVYFRIYEKGKDKGDKAVKELEEIPNGSEELTLNNNSWIVKALAVSGEILIKDELAKDEEILGEEFINSIKKEMQQYGGEAVVPIIVDEKIESIMILGGKLSGDIFSNEDVNLLDTLSYQTSIAIKNAKLYAEKVHSARLASIGMVSGTFAHEIRNPLTSIKTFAQLMPEKYADPEFRDSFSKIVVNEIERIDGLIKDLMSFSGKKAETPNNYLDLTALVDETLNNVIKKLELEKSKITIEKVYKNVKIHTFGDSKKLAQAFINIISNGCQAMKDNGLLKVNIIPKEREVDITFTDTGKGIDPDEIRSIFDPFYTKRPMGVGLGLAISKKIVEDHGGRIGVESKMLKGTTFTISLPLQN